MKVDYSVMIDKSFSLFILEISTKHDISVRAVGVRIGAQTVDMVCINLQGEGNYELKDN